MIKKIFITLFSIFWGFLGKSQEFNFNQGGATKSGYYAAIPYENVQGKILIHAEIHGKKYNFIFDTGASDFISKEVCDELKLPVISKQAVSDITSKQDSLLVVSINIILGGVEFNQIPTIVSSSLFFSGCLHIDGIIGSNLLRNSIFRVSSKDKMIFITDSEKNFTLNKKQSSDIVLTSDSHPLIWIKLKNKKSANEQLFFDTGFDGFYSLALSHFNVFKKHDIYNVVTKGYGSNSFGFYASAAADTVQYKVIVPQMNINGALFENVSSHTIANNNSLIGSKLFEYGYVTVDYRNKKFYFEPFQDTVNYKDDEWAFSITYKNGKLVVGLIWDGLLKEKLNVGDQILSIDSINLEKFDPCEFFTKQWPQLKLKTTLLLVIINNKGNKQELNIDKLILK